MKSNRWNSSASLMLENTYFGQGYRKIVGFDEAGRGAWAGPVFAGAACLPLDRDDLAHVLKGVRDSKLMTPRQRSKMVEVIKTTAVAWGVGSASNSEIDILGINAATHLAMQRALAMAQVEPDFLLLDSLRWPEMEHIPHLRIAKADSLSLTVAAASVLAKVSRDEYMREISADYPHHHFSDHKGYGTAKHMAALDTYGVTPLHRSSFKPIRMIALR
jgi:ribonuclease HII